MELQKNYVIVKFGDWIGRRYHKKTTLNNKEYLEAIFEEKKDGEWKPAFKTTPLITVDLE